MGERRQARIAVLQALFYVDMDGGDPRQLLTDFSTHFAGEIDGVTTPFFESLSTGVTASRDQLDDILGRYATNWRVDRMSVVDRNILRMATYEFLNCTDVPATVSINEAVDIGKQFGTRATGPFVNGVLDRIRMAENIS